MDFQVGQPIFVIYNHHRSPALKPYVVTKVGRKWVHFNSSGAPDAYFEQFDRITLQVSGGAQHSNIGQVWLSEEAYLENERCNKLWSAFKSQVHYNCPKAITSSQILEAAAVLGIKLDTVP